MSTLWRSIWSIVCLGIPLALVSFGVNVAEHAMIHRYAPVTAGELTVDGPGTPCPYTGPAASDACDTLAREHEQHIVDASDAYIAACDSGDTGRCNAAATQVVRAADQSCPGYDPSLLPPDASADCTPSCSYSDPSAMQMCMARASASASIYAGGDDPSRMP